MAKQPCPETRGSHLAGELERLRASKLLNRAQRRRLAKLERGAPSVPAQKEEESMTTAKRGRSSIKIGTNLREELLKHIGARTREQVVADLNAIDPHKQGTEGAWAMVCALRKNPDHRWTRHSVSILSKLNEHYRTGASPSEVRHASVTTAIVAPTQQPENEAMRAFVHMFEEQNKRIDALFQELRSARGEKPKAEVVGFQREQVNKLVKAAAAHDRMFEERFTMLFSQFALENRYGFRERAEALGMKTTAPGWRLDVLEKDNRMGEFVDLAKRLFGYDAADGAR